MPRSPRVLSIQSHVVAGCVGNKAAVFPLQLLGFEVDAVNTVQFSNHTGYPLWKGRVLSGEELWDLIDAMETNGLLSQYTHLLTGFIGSLSLLHTIHRVLLKLREYNPALVYVCDPVQGDNGQLYVSPDLPPAFRSELTPIATIMTPNQLEAELLTKRSIGSVQEALDACAQLHRLGPHTVVITSLDLEPDHVTVLASTTQPQAEGALSTFRILVPRVQAYVTGTGDLFTALLLGWLHKEPGHVQLAVEKALAGLQIILRDSVGTEADGQAPENWQRTKRTAEICRQRELQLVQHSEALIHPHVTYRAEAVP
ncbi:PDX2 [Auxenochlorella protothecoides x Auxenochlorella symbiontica]